MYIVFIAEVWILLFHNYTYIIISWEILITNNFIIIIYLTDSNNITINTYFPIIITCIIISTHANVVMNIDRNSVIDLCGNSIIINTHISFFFLIDLILFLLNYDVMI